jgi:hypothetical protein
MTDLSFDSCESFDSCKLDSMEHASLPRKIFTHTIPVLAAVSFSALVALRVAGGLASDAINASQPTAARTALSNATPTTIAPSNVALVEAAPESSSKAVAPRIAVAPQANAVSNPYGELLDPQGAGTGEKSIFAEAKPVGPAFSLFQSDPLYPADGEQQVAEAEPAPDPEAPLVANAREPSALGLRLAEDQSVVPLPPTRPADLPRIAKVEEDDEQDSRAQSSHAKEAKEDSRAKEEPRAKPAPRVSARRSSPQQASMTQNDPRNFFEKLFGGSQDKGPQLAYASPDGGSALKLSRGAFAAARPPEASGGVAVYNIAAHTVTLPSGERLEAHSGLGPYFDNPAGVHLRMRGSTPPATYQLSLRESMFHGVQALRLTPLDSNVYGRGGLLAHTFMLGQRGDSNGCVSFRNYRAFLEAFRNGEVRKLRVVAGG